MNTSTKIRLIYASAVPLLIALGLLSRKVGFIPDPVGDALWAMTVYCCWRIMLAGKPRIVSAAAALVTSYAVEFSQLLSPDWLVRIRSTFPGHMLLGQGFLWSDLIAYTLGIAVIFLITELVVRRLFPRSAPENKTE